MAATMKLEVTTPSGLVYSNDVEMVTLPGEEGEMGIYPMHIPLLAMLDNGEVIARRSNTEDRLLVTGGCAMVTPDKVSIITVFATEESKIDEKKAEEARARAEARLKEKLLPNETAFVQAALKHSSTQLKIRRHRH